MPSFFLLFAVVSCLLFADCSADAATSKSDVSGVEKSKVSVDKKAPVAATEPESSLGAPGNPAKSEPSGRPIFKKGVLPKPQENDGSKQASEKKRPDDVADWNKMAGSMVSELKDTGLNVDTCLPGLKVDSEKNKRTLILNQGKIAGFTKFYHRNDAKLVGQTPGVVEFQMNLAFENLRLEYMYEYIPNSLRPNKKRQGPLILELKGESVVSLSAAVYKFVLASSAQRDQCPLAITDMKITQLGIQFKTLKVHSSFFTRTFYFFMKLLSPTVRGVTGLVRSIQDNIKKDVSDALHEVVGTAVKGLKKVCAMEQKWKPRDCNAINYVGHPS